VRFYKLDLADVIVFHDELDLVPGKVRVKAGGGVAGHNGLRSITAHIGNDYVRVRIGIGHPGSKDVVVHHVLTTSPRLIEIGSSPARRHRQGGARSRRRASDKFQSFVAQAMHMEARVPMTGPNTPAQAEDAASAAGEKPAAAEGPFGRLRRWFGS
jgi:PTH1 family peptidyl-tRNA hydrolase